MNWILFNIFVLAMLAIDLGIFHRKAHEVKLKEALTWSGVWITLAMIFNAGIYYWQGSKPALEFFTGYIIEKSLSVDNIFVFIMVFSYFRVPALYQHKVLFWGILGALVMRAALIIIGAALLAKFHWVIYLFGGFLLFTGIKMLTAKETPFDPDKNPAVRLFKRFLPVTSTYQEDRFFIRKEGRLWATPLFLVLFIIELTDLVFAVDSIPAIFAVTNDPFIVYTSNVFAILGLRSLYFALAGMVDKFRYLKTGLAFVLMFVGIKMLLVGVLKISSVVSLGIIAVILTLAVVISLWESRNRPLPPVDKPARLPE
jgi:tellurite resistance protein TerC